MRKPKPITPKPLPKRIHKWLEDVAYAPQGAESLTLGRDSARAILAALAHDRQTVDALLSAGAPLSNAAFNLKQRDSLSESDRTALEAAQQNWDAAARKARE